MTYKTIDELLTYARGQKADLEDKFSYSPLSLAGNLRENLGFVIGYACAMGYKLPDGLRDELVLDPLARNLELTHKN